MAVDRPSTFIVLCCSFFSIGYVLTISQLALVEGLYIVQAQIHSYGNSNQLRIDECFGNICFAACCDGGEGGCTSGGRRCDTFFLFCLRSFSDTPIGCDSNRDIVMQSDDNNNDGNIDFSQSTFLGLSNPLVFQGLTNSWNVSYQYSVYIKDFGLHDILLETGDPTRC